MNSKAEHLLNLLVAVAVGLGAALGALLGVSLEDLRSPAHPSGGGRDSRAPAVAARRHRHHVPHWAS